MNHAGYSGEKRIAMDNRSHDHRNTNDSHEDAGRGPFERDEALVAERLSAYLDGECTAAEQSELEARMAANVEFRQLVEDLRSVRSSLEVLPRHRLDTDFAERVLRRAEREVLVGGAKTHPAADDPSAVEPHVAPMASSPSPVPVVHDHSLRTARPFLWIIAALAAAVLILVTNREPQIRLDPIAQGPPAKLQEDRERRTSSPAETDAKTVNGNEAEGLQTPALSGSSAGVGRREEAASATLNDLDNRRSADFADGAKPPEPPTPVPDSGGREKARFAERVLENPIKDNLSLKSQMAAGAAGRPAPPMPNETPANGNSELDDARADKLTDSARPRSAQDQVRLHTPLATGRRGDAKASDLRLTPAEESVLNDGLRPAPTDAVADENATLGQKLAPGASEPSFANKFGLAGAKQDAQSTASPSDSLRVVEVVVARDAWQQGAVEDLFSRNQIAVFDGQRDRELAEAKKDADRQTASPSLADSSDRHQRKEADLADEVKKESRDLSKDVKAGESLESLKAAQDDAVRQSGVPTSRAVRAPAEAPPSATPPALSAPARISEKGKPAAARTAGGGERPISNELELLVVSATSAQIEAAISDLAQQHDQFQVLQVTDASMPKQLYERSLSATAAERTPAGFGAARGGTSPADRARLGRMIEQSASDASGLAVPAPDTLRSATDVGQTEVKNAVAESAKRKTEAASGGGGTLRKGQSDPAAKPSSTADEVLQKQETQLRNSYRRAVRGKDDSPPIDKKLADEKTKESTTEAAAEADKPAPTAPLSNERLEKKAAAQAANGALDSSSNGPAVAGRGIAGGAGGIESRSGGFGGGTGAPSGGAARSNRGGLGAGIGGGGIGGAGYGTSAPRESFGANAPRGYAERVRLQAGLSLESSPAVNVLDQFRTTQQLDAVDLNEGGKPYSLASERVLFLFHIVDAPLAKGDAARAAGATAAKTRTDEATKQTAGKSESRETPLVPAPAAPSAK